MYAYSLDQYEQRWVQLEVRNLTAMCEKQKEKENHQ
jgi:hypothetical protein